MGSLSKNISANLLQKTAYEQFWRSWKKALPRILNSFPIPSWIGSCFQVLKGEYDEKCVELKGVVFYDVNKQMLDGNLLVNIFFWGDVWSAGVWYTQMGGCWWVMYQTSGGFSSWEIENCITYPACCHPSTPTACWKWRLKRINVCVSQSTINGIQHWTPLWQTPCEPND